jgi:hypothetical protein
MKLEKGGLDDEPGLLSSSANIVGMLECFGMNVIDDGSALQSSRQIQHVSRTAFHRDLHE